MSEVGTVKYQTQLFYLVTSADGSEARVLRTAHTAKKSEYVFRLLLRVPTVQRPHITGELTVDLPPDVSPDADPSVEVAGPVEQ